MNYTWPTIGNDKLKKNLEYDLNHTLFHAYLIAGPEAIGKWEIAKTFAKFIQTKDSPDAEIIARQIELDEHIDTHICITEESQIKISQIRAIIQKTYTSAQANKKIFLLKDIHKLTNEAANALLKTLEEPPKDTIFIMTTSSTFKIPDTILSRVKTLTSNCPKQEQLYTELAKEFDDKSEKQIQDAIFYSDGKTKRAREILEDNSLLEKLEEISNSVFVAIEQKDINKWFSLLEIELKNEKVNLEEVLLNVIRKIILFKINNGEQANLNSYLEMAKDLIEYIKRRNQHFNKKLYLENMFITHCLS